MPLLTQRTDNLSTHVGQQAAGATSWRCGRKTAPAKPRKKWPCRAAVECWARRPTYVTGTAFVITWLWRWCGLFYLGPQPGEVAEVFEVPLQYLMNPAHHRSSGMAVRQRLSMPYHHVSPDDPDSSGTVERFIWGANGGHAAEFCTGF
jgi:hypothetical protein